MSKLIFTVVKIVGDSTGEDSTIEDIDLLVELKEMTLSLILSKIFSQMLFENIRFNFLALKFDQSDDVLNNEIAVWIGVLNDRHPNSYKNIAFKKPDYNETEFYNIQYKYESNKITIEEIIQYLDTQLKTEHLFLESIASSLITLLNNKGDISSLLPEQLDSVLSKAFNFLSF